MEFKEQDIVAHSTVEAEYTAATSAVNQAIWIRKLLADLCIEQDNATQIHIDNQTHFSYFR